MKSPHFECPTIFLYDRVQGGVGLSELLFEAHRDLFGAALDVVTRCSCELGCPACVGPVAEVGLQGKAVAAKLLAHFAGGAIPVERDPEEGLADEDTAGWVSQEDSYAQAPRGAATEGL